ncbi:MAG: AAA family ATPase, partial [Lysobacterales bacterium]
IKMLTDVLNQYLLEAHAKGRRTVLIIDEAQNLSADVLEQIRLLTNLETSTQKLLQIILIGQPELRTLLQNENLRQLAQRVTARYRLEPLTREETGTYIKHRLQICGATRPIFKKSAVDRIYKLSGGIPRLINVLCDRALLGAYSEDKLQIDKKIIRVAANEVLADELQQSRARLNPKLLAGGLVVLILASIMAYVFWQDPDVDHVLNDATAQSAPEGSADDTSADNVSSQASMAPPSNAVPDATALSGLPSQSGSLAAALLAADQSWPLAAWTELFARWSVKLPAAVAPEYCVFANEVGLYCMLEKGSWGLLRQYNRPVIMGLFNNDSQAVPVVLQHLDDGVAELIIGNESVRLPVAEVDRYWRGDFTLLLRAPPNGHFLLAAGDRNPDVAWLRQLLEEAQQVELPADDPQYFDILLQTQVMDFQRRHGLTPDGMVGKQTLIQLGTYTDRDVPLLSVETS